MRKIMVIPSLCVTILFATILSYAQSTAAPMSTGPIQATDFGFACNFDNPGTCQNAAWITTASQPGTLRLHDTGTNWARLSPGNGSYNWTSLDLWLDAIAAHSPRAVLYTFSHVPCWNVNPVCSDIRGSSDLPVDLTASGSPSFNAFVTALTEHCSPAGHCVKDSIKYFELWNEPNSTSFWNGTAQQLYEMMKPAVAILRAKVPGVLITTPAPYMTVTPTWMDDWLALENTKGRLSDIFGFHAYIGPGSVWNTANDAPEIRFPIMVSRMLAKKNNAGWTTTPWINTETGFLGAGPFIPTDCPLNQGATDAVCNDYLARWFILQFAEGAEHIDWYWFSAINHQDATYHELMNWLVGSRFAGPCTNQGSVYTCSLTQPNGSTALLVWDTNGSSTYYPAAQYVDYKDLNGGTASIGVGQAATIGSSPMMFEAGSPHTPPVAVLAITPQSGSAPLIVTADSSRSSDDGTIVSWTTNWGDGSTPATATTATHSYNTPGAYTITLRVTDNAGRTSSTTQTLTVSALAPVAALSVTPQIGAVALNVTADSSGSSVSSGKLTSRSIDFGDGTAAATAATATHTYGIAGNYTVTLTVKDTNGQAATATKVVRVSGPPAAVLTLTPQSGTAPLTVSADSSASSEVNGTIVSRTIDFGGSTAAMTTAPINYVYQNAGSYIVTLKATDALGVSANTTKMVTVSAPTPTCKISGVQRSITICAPVAGTTVPSALHVTAVATDSSPIKSMTVWVNGVMKYRMVGAGPLDTYISGVSPGSTALTVYATDASGNLFHQKIAFTLK